MPDSETLLGGRSAAEFLREYWQKKPLLIRGAIPDFESPISPEELAGLALEEDAEARLILEKGGDHPWQLRHGPFEEDDFLALSETHWTLLVQEVDQWVPEVADLLQRFQFIPKWRIDDVMVSFAPDKGNVGAHVDNYDVFLLQASGKREWRIHSTPVDEETIVPDLDVRMLSDFEPDEVWTLEAGDMLYLPPRVPHHGIAVGDCMTFSIGFRAPSHEELLSALLARALEDVDPAARYSDPDLELQDHPALISETAIQRVREILVTALTKQNIARWFGELVTESKRPEYLLSSEKRWSPEELVEEIRAGARLERVSPDLFAYTETGGTILFAHGEAIPIDNDHEFAAPLLAGSKPLNSETLSAHFGNASFTALLTKVVNLGHLVLER